MFSGKPIWMQLGKTIKTGPKSDARDVGFTGCPEEVAKLPAKWAPQMLSRWASSMFAAYTCISVSWNLFVKWMYPQGGCSTKPSCSTGHITSCYHLCRFENHPLCTHWIPLMVFFGAELSVFTVDGCWWTMVSSSVSSGSGLMLAFWTIASVGRGGWNTGMEKIAAGSKKDSTLCFWYKPPSKSIYIIFDASAFSRAMM